MKIHSREPDICPRLLQTCEKCQHDLLDIYGITCLFDVDSGKLSRWRCDVLERIVESSMRTICDDRDGDDADGRITVTLRHRDDFWILAVRDQGIRTHKGEHREPLSTKMRALVGLLSGDYRWQETADGMLMVIMFRVSEKPDYLSLDKAEFSPSPLDTRDSRLAHSMPRPGEMIH